MVDITEITMVMAITIITITDHTIECIMEEVIHYQVIAEPVDQCQTQGSLARREFHVT